MSRVSFILPAYKHQFLRKAIASILAQTYRDFELVVVDDCSPEDLKSVVDEFHDERLVYHRNKVNIGSVDLVAAWNTAMDYATGEWCVLASDDDVYAPGYLDRMLGLVDKYPRADVFHCRINVISSDDSVIECANVRPEYETVEAMLKSRTVEGCLQCMPEFMFRRREYLRVGGFVSFPRAWFSDDASVLRLALKSGCVCAGETLFSWRRSGQNISSCFDDALQKVVAAERFREFAQGMTALPVGFERAIDRHEAMLIGNASMWRCWRMFKECSRPIEVGLMSLRERAIAIRNRILSQ